MPKRAPTDACCANTPSTRAQLGELAGSVDMAVITMAGLPDPLQARAYQLWLMGPDHDPIPSGTMESGDVGPTASARVEGIADSAQIGLTEEPAGGSPAPTGDVLLALDLA